LSIKIIQETTVFTLLYNKQKAFCKSRTYSSGKQNKYLQCRYYDLISKERFSVLDINIVNKTKATTELMLLTIFKPKGTGEKCFCNFFLKYMEGKLVLRASKLVTRLSKYCFLWLEKTATLRIRIPSYAFFYSFSVATLFLPLQMHN
jgi:hypothetical protein